MPNVLKEKIAGMTDQQAAKLSRELQEFWQLFDDPKAFVVRIQAAKEFPFPLMSWLVKAIKLEGTVAEQIHLCTPCRKGNHKLHGYDYMDVDSKVWICRCVECAGNPPPIPPEFVGGSRK